MPEGLLFVPANRGPLRAYLRARWSRRSTSAVVFMADDRDTRPVARGRPDLGLGVGVFELLGGRFRWVYEVGLGEHPESFRVPVARSDGLSSLEVEIQLLWWVHDPAHVVRQRVSDPRQYLQYALDDRVARVASDVEDPQIIQERLTGALAQAQRLGDVGVTYGHGRVRVREADNGHDLDNEVRALQREIAVEELRQKLTLKRVQFYRSLVVEGIPSLLALWLVKDPDAIADVVTQAVNVREADRGSAGAATGDGQLMTLEGKLGELFAGLDEHERHRLRELVGRELAKSGHDDVLREFLAEPDRTGAASATSTASSNGVAPPRSDSK